MHRHSAFQHTALKSWPASVPRWMALTVAILLLSALVLSPRYAEKLQLQARYQANRSQLLTTGADVHHLEQLEHALRTDPEFVARIAVAEMLPRRPNGLNFPVSQGSSQISGKPLTSAQTTTLKQTMLSRWHDFIVRLAAEHSTFRWGLALSSAAFFIYAFQIMKKWNKRPHQAMVRTTYSAIRWLASRYQKPSKQQLRSKRRFSDV